MRSEGQLLGQHNSEPESFRKIYLELGHQIFLIGSTTVPQSTIPLLNPHEEPDAPLAIERSATKGVLTSEDAKFLLNWVHRNPLPSHSTDFLLTHNDVHPWNLLVKADQDVLVNILDWGDAAWSDPSVEFASMPLASVPTVVRGFIESGGTWSEDLALRVAHRGLECAIWELREPGMLHFERHWWRLPHTGVKDALKIR